MSNSTGPLADKYPRGKMEGVKHQAVSTRLGFFPVPVSLSFGWVARRVEEENHLLESFARECLEASCPLGWVLSWLLPFIL